MELLEIILNLRNFENSFYFYCGLFVLILVVFLLFFSLRFGQISPLAFFRWLTATSDRNAKSYNGIPSNCCSYKTQHSYPTSRLITWRRPEVKFGRNVVRKTTKKLPRWGQKVRNKNKINSQIKKPPSQKDSQ